MAWDASKRRKGTQEAKSQKPKHRGSNRETLESVVIAFVLAFLFRTFEAEAFVIPTGSMAPTLMGRHKDVTCPECGQSFQVGASENEKGPDDCVCPNCSYHMDISEDIAFKGDRILVVKSLYGMSGVLPASLSRPQRWDVVVFKFPEEPQTNYIKRLVGLPDEEVKIQAGNIYVRTSADEPFHIARKSPEKQTVMRMLVFDNNHQAKSIRENGGQPRWQPYLNDAWQLSDDWTTFHFKPDASDKKEWSYVRYAHLAEEWEDSLQLPSRPEFISDFYGYNSGFLDPCWVNELCLSVQARVSEPDTEMRFELVKGGRYFICEFDFKRGECRLLHRSESADADEQLAVARDVCAGSGTYTLGFSDFDERLTIWINGSPVAFKGLDSPDEFPYLDCNSYAEPESWLPPTEDDLHPARIAARGGPVTLTDIVLYRDIYYTQGNGSRAEYRGLRGHGLWRELTPENWRKAEPNETVLNLGAKEYLMLGDNSPRSKDGRLWDHGVQSWLNELSLEHKTSYDEMVREVAREPGGEIVDAPRHVVREQLIIGKAFFIYWPHGVPVFKNGWDIHLGNLGTFRVPFYPQITRMKRIN